MNETISNLTGRRSIKSFRPDPVSDEVLDQILAAGLNAPTGKNVQHTVMVAVRDKAIRDQLSRMNAEILGSDADPFYGAPCVVVVLADPVRDTWVEDGALVMGNMLNAAYALGIGGCWIHRARQMFACDEGKALLRKWGLPEHLEGIGNCVLGYAEGETMVKPRLPGRIIKVD